MTRGDGQIKLNIDSASIAEVLFLLILIYMISGPFSGLVLSTQSWVSSLITKSAHTLQSARYLAEELIKASARIKLLEKQLADTQLMLAEATQHKQDIERLRALLGLKEKLNRSTIASEIITRAPDNWFDEVTIDKGSLDHVQKGSAVITNLGVVGQVVKVADHVSVVRLLTDPDQKLGVLIQRIATPGVLTGHHRRPAMIDYVPIGTSVEIGDQVVCLGNGGIFPAGHPIGKVSGIRRDVNGTTLSIEVTLSENFYDLTQVLVVPPAVL